MKKKTIVYPKNKDFNYLDMHIDFDRFTNMNDSTVDENIYKTSEIPLNLMFYFVGIVGIITIIAFVVVTFMIL